MMVVGPDHQAEPTGQYRDDCVEKSYLLILERPHALYGLFIIFRRGVQESSANHHLVKPCRGGSLPEPVEHQGVAFQKRWIGDYQLMLFAVQAFQFALCPNVMLIVAVGRGI